jgi:hypothetical protein
MAELVNPGTFDGNVFGPAAANAANAKTISKITEATTENRIISVFLNPFGGTDSAAYPEIDNLGALLMANPVTPDGITAPIASASFAFWQFAGDRTGAIHAFARAPGTTQYNYLRTFAPAISPGTKFNLWRPVTSAMTVVASPTSAGGSQGLISGFSLNALPDTAAQNLRTVDTAFLTASAKSTAYSMVNQVATVGLFVTSTGTTVPAMMSSLTTSLAPQDVYRAAKWSTLPDSNAANDGWIAVAAPAAAATVIFDSDNATTPVLPNEFGPVHITGIYGCQASAAGVLYGTVTLYRTHADPATHVATTTSRAYIVYGATDSICSFFPNFFDYPQDSSSASSTYYGIITRITVTVTAAALSGRLGSFSFQTLSCQSLYFAYSPILRACNAVYVSGLSSGQTVSLSGVYVIEGVADPSIAPFTGSLSVPWRAGTKEALQWALSHRAALQCPAVCTLAQHVQRTNGFYDDFSVARVATMHAASVPQWAQLIPGALRSLGAAVGHPAIGDMAGRGADLALDIARAWPASKHAAGAGEAWHASSRRGLLASPQTLVATLSSVIVRREPLTDASSPEAVLLLSEIAGTTLSTLLRDLVELAHPLSATFSDDGALLRIRTPFSEHVFDHVETEPAKRDAATIYAILSGPEAMLSTLAQHIFDEIDFLPEAAAFFRRLEGEHPIRNGCPARARAHTIPKSSEELSRKADAGQKSCPY